MKLRDAIENRDYSNFKKVESPSFDFGYGDALAHDLYGTSIIDYEHYNAVIETGRVAQYPIREWLCTDTYVGLYLFTVDEEPVCLVYRDGRKNDPQWKFFSKESFQKLKALFDECMPPDQETRYSLIDEDFLNLSIDPDLFESNVSEEQMGYSPLERHRWVLKYMDHMKDLTEDYVEELHEALHEHAAMLIHIKLMNDTERLEKFEKSEDIYKALNPFVASLRKTT